MRISEEKNDAGRDENAGQRASESLDGSIRSSNSGESFNRFVTGNTGKQCNGAPRPDLGRPVPGSIVLSPELGLKYSFSISDIHFKEWSVYPANGSAHEVVKRTHIFEKLLHPCRHCLRDYVIFVVVLKEKSICEHSKLSVWARYDPPFMPWFLRRNEVLIPIEKY
jgi:hypothetical protein